MDESLFCAMPDVDMDTNGVAYVQPKLKSVTISNDAANTFVSRFRLCYECGEIIASGDDFVRHILAHEVASIALQLYHFEEAERREMSEHLQRVQAKKEATDRKFNSKLQLLDQQYLSTHIPDSSQVFVDLSSTEVDDKLTELERKRYFHPLHQCHLRQAVSNDSGFSDTELDVMGTDEDENGGNALAWLGLRMPNEDMGTPPICNLMFSTPNVKKSCQVFDLSSNNEVKYKRKMKIEVQSEMPSPKVKPIRKVAPAKKRFSSAIRNSNGDTSESDWSPSVERAAAKRRQIVVHAAAPPPRKRHRPSAEELEEKAAVLNLFKQLSYEYEEKGNELLRPLPCQKVKKPKPPVVEQKLNVVTRSQKQKEEFPKQNEGLVFKKDEGLASKRDEGLTPKQDEGLAPEQDEGLALKQDEGLAFRKKEGLASRTKEGLASRKKEGLISRKKAKLALRKKEGVASKRNKGPKEKKGLAPRKKEGLASRKKKELASKRNKGPKEKKGLAPRKKEGLVPRKKRGLNDKSISERRHPRTAKQNINYVFKCYNR